MQVTLDQNVTKSLVQLLAAAIHPTTPFAMVFEHIKALEAAPVVEEKNVSDAG